MMPQHRQDLTVHKGNNILARNYPVKPSRVFCRLLDEIWQKLLAAPQLREINVQVSAKLVLAL